jgi:hypothetical protein
MPAKAVDALVMLTYVLGALYVLHGLWIDPNGRYLQLNYQDHIVFEWMYAHATEVLTHGESPFFSGEVNSPNGINLMANTSMLALALPLTPVTLWLGAGVTFALVMTLALAGTAAAWYWALTRELGRSRPAALIGAGFLGFAPSTISQAAGHPNIAGQYLIPLIIVAVLRMRHPGHVWRHGLTLAGLVLAQAFINEEMLFLTAVALTVFFLAYVPWSDLPGLVKVLLPKAGVTLLVAGAVLAYPLHYQFNGPQSYRGLDSGTLTMNADVLSYVAYGRYSIADTVSEATRLGLNRRYPSEENAFYGGPLMLLLVVGALVLWRNRLSRALAVTGAVFALLSLGKLIRFNELEHTHVPGPWQYISKLPLFDTVVPTRLSLVVTTAIGVGLALFIDRLIIDRLAAVPAAAAEPATDGPEEPVAAKEPPARPRRRVPASALVWGLAAFVALLPLFPTPQPVNGLPPIPSLFTGGRWRTSLPAEAVVVPLPGGWPDNFDVMRWSVSTDMEVTFAGGYFLGPNDGHPEDRSAHFGPGERPTWRYLDQVRHQSKGVPAVTDAHREALRADVVYWRATTLVLPVTNGRESCRTTCYPNADVELMRQTVDKLVGPDVAPGRLVDGVWLWDVRTLGREVQPTGR